MMKREIKFRCYDSDTNRMYYNVGIEPLGYTIFEFNGDKMTPPEQVGWIGKDLDEHNIMQFTGLLDRNGKEIYEGDIVKIFNQIGKIEYSDFWGGYIFLCDKLGENKDLPFCDGKESNAPYCEIIGNIHENPELL